MEKRRDDFDHAPAVEAHVRRRTSNMAVSFWDEEGKRASEYPRLSQKTGHTHESARFRHVRSCNDLEEAPACILEKQNAESSPSSPSLSGFGSANCGIEAQVSGRREEVLYSSHYPTIMIPRWTCFRATPWEHISV